MSGVCCFGKWCRMDVYECYEKNLKPVTSAFGKFGRKRPMTQLCPGLVLWEDYEAYRTCKGCRSYFFEHINEPYPNSWVVQILNFVADKRGTSTRGKDMETSTRDMNDLRKLITCSDCGGTRQVNHPGMVKAKATTSGGPAIQIENKPPPVPVPPVLDISDMGGAAGGSREAGMDPKGKQWDSTWQHLCAVYNLDCWDIELLEYEREMCREVGRTPVASPASDYGKVLNQIEKTNLITPTFPFECVICFTDVDPGEGVTLQTCLHSFCRSCVVGSIEFSEAVEFQCPYQDGTESCSAFILDKEVKALCPEAVLEKVLKRSLTQAEMNMKNSFHCCTANCDAWIEIGEDSVAYRCVLCAKVNCIKCKAIHEAMTCPEYQARLQMTEADVKTRAYIKQMAAKNEAMKCPQCQIWIIRVGGCDWVVCLACRTEICWATKGFRWGPKGKGDTTGGCRCMENGVRCVPNCGNCH